jgi:hypothetical protein
MIVVAVVGLADWLFYGHVIGISLVVFLIALAIATAFANPIAERRGELPLGTGVLLTGLRPDRASLRSSSLQVRPRTLLSHCQAKPHRGWQTGRPPQSVYSSTAGGAPLSISAGRSWAGAGQRDASRVSEFSSAKGLVAGH